MWVQMCGGEIQTDEHPNFSVKNKSVPHCQSHIPNGLAWDRTNLCGTYSYITDFDIPYVSDVIHERINKHHNKVEAHPNPLSEPILQPVNTGRLKRSWPLELRKRHLR